MTKSQIPLLIPYLLIVSALFHVLELTFPISFVFSAHVESTANLLFIPLLLFHFFNFFHNSSQNKIFLIEAKRNENKIKYHQRQSSPLKFMGNWQKKLNISFILHILILFIILLNFSSSYIVYLNSRFVASSHLSQI